MASFFEKLKKGMGVEAEAGESREPAEKPKRPKIKKELREPARNVPATTSKMSAGAGGEIKAEEKVKINNEGKAVEQKNEVKIEKSEGTRPSSAKDSEGEKKWAIFNKDQEGQLALDVYQTEDFLVLQSAIAGVKPESLDIVIEGDMVAIKGNREKPEEKGDRNYFYQECFWGPFSRQIVLSVEVDPGRAEATLKEGILTIRLPKIERDKKRKLVVQG